VVENRTKPHSAVRHFIGVIIGYRELMMEIQEAHFQPGRDWSQYI
jgi:hypothetical protein